MKLFTDGLNVTNKLKQPESWNSMFHQICSLCNLEYEFPPWTMPSSYSKNQTCGHIQQVNLDKTTTNSLYLAALDNMSNSTFTNFSLSVAAMFIQSVVYKSPVWDIGLQQQLMNNNTDKLFNMEMTKVHRYTTKCICPCGTLFKNWHNQIHIIPRLVQSTYSILLAKFWLKNLKDTNE